MSKQSKTRRKRLLEMQWWVCYRCNEKSESYHIDHIHPKCRWWENLEYNLCMSCISCNLLKTDLPKERYNKLIWYYKKWICKREDLKKLKKLLFIRNRSNVENSYDMNWLLVRYLDWFSWPHREIDISTLYNKWQELLELSNWNTTKKDMIWDLNR